jgi:lipoprotein-releasing system ATP-binding protein
MNILSATEIHKSFRLPGQAPTEVLRGSNLSCTPGEFLAIVGPSGAGKSTLLHVLASLEIPDSGTVTVHVDDTAYQYNTMSASDLATFRARNIGMVFQFHHLLPEFTAIENVMMPSLIIGASSKEARTRANELLELVGVAHRAEHAPAELSGGEQQRVALARAMMNRPRILFADEPTGNLDTENAAHIADVLVELQRSTGVTCIIATHSIELASKAHRIISMRDGRCMD